MTTLERDATTASRSLLRPFIVPFEYNEFLAQFGDQYGVHVVKSRAELEQPTRKRMFLPMKEELAEVKLYRFPYLRMTSRRCGRFLVVDADYGLDAGSIESKIAQLNQLIESMPVRPNLIGFNISEAKRSLQMIFYLDVVAWERGWARVLLDQVYAGMNARFGGDRQFAREWSRNPLYMLDGFEYMWFVTDHEQRSLTELHNYYAIHDNSKVADPIVQQVEVAADNYVVRPGRKQTGPIEKERNAAGQIMRKRYIYRTCCQVGAIALRRGETVTGESLLTVAQNAYQEVQSPGRPALAPAKVRKEAARAAKFVNETFDPQLAGQRPSAPKSPHLKKQQRAGGRRSGAIAKATGRWESDVRPLGPPSRHENAIPRWLEVLAHRKRHGLSIRATAEALGVDKGVVERAVAYGKTLTEDASHSPNLQVSRNDSCSYHAEPLVLTMAIEVTEFCNSSAHVQTSAVDNRAQHRATSAEQSSQVAHSRCSPGRSTIYRRSAMAPRSPAMGPQIAARGRRRNFERSRASGPANRPP